MKHLRIEKIKTLSDNTSHICSIENYTSLHDFLDAFFQNILNPSDEDILTAKKKYWRYKNKLAKRKWRQEHTICSIAFTNEELHILKPYIVEGEPLSTFIKNQILLLAYKDSLQRPINVSVIEQQLFIITDYLEEIVDNEWVIDTDRLHVLEEHVQELQKRILQEFDHKDKVI